MVFLIQRTQNKDALAIHLKLNELVAALQGASNRLIEVEDLTEEDLQGPRNGTTASWQAGPRGSRCRPVALGRGSPQPALRKLNERMAEASEGRQCQ